MEQTTTDQDRGESSNRTKMEACLNGISHT